MNPRSKVIRESVRRKSRVLAALIEAAPQLQATAAETQRIITVDAPTGQTLTDLQVHHDEVVETNKKIALILKPPLRQA